MSDIPKPQRSPELMELRHEFLVRAVQLDLEPKVLGDGRLDAEIIIIGQGPGSQEVLAKSPFVGPTGRVLWDTLRSHGILRPDVYVTNVCKRQYSTDAKSDLPKDEWIRWYSLLQWELSQLKNPKYIFALGNNALECLSGHSGITDYRGSVYDYTISRSSGPDTPVKVLYSYNPANVLRNPEQEIIFQFDARRLKTLKLGDWQDWTVVTHRNPSFEEAMQWIRNCRAACKPTAFDLELTGGQLACVGMAWDLHEAWCINFRKQLTSSFTPEEELRLMMALQDLYEFLYEHDCVVVQNGAFDSGYHGVKDWVHMPINWDTMVMHHTLYPSLPHNLGFLTSQYTTMPYYKDDYDTFKEEGDVEVFWDYNGKDCCATLASFYKLKKELEQQNLLEFYTRHVKREANHLIQGMVRGIATDAVERAKVSKEMEAEVENLKEHVYTLINLALPPNEGEKAYRPNLDSWQQLQRLFYNHLNLKDARRGTDEDARNRLIDDSRTPIEAKEILVAINKYRSAAKFAGTYVDLRLDEDGRFRCVWKQEGVRSAPGRLSSSQTLWGTGMNGQNQPPAARKFFIADPGCVFIYFDLKQAEAQIVAYRADIPKWKEQFAQTRIDDSYDAHRALASDMFKMPYELVPKSDRNDDDTEYTVRYVAKRCRHGLNYRMQIPRLAEQANLSYSRAAQAFHFYHRSNPEIEAWWREQERLVRKEREIFNAFGRRYRVLQRIDDDALVPIIAFYPQSTIGDKVRSVWYQSEEDDRWDTQKARVVLNVHDALIAVATKEYAKTALSIMKAYAETPIMVENVYRTKRDLLSIGADTAISTTIIRDRKTKEIIGEDRYHRWSNLEKVKIEAATL